MDKHLHQPHDQPLQLLGQFLQHLRPRPRLLLQGDKRQAERRDPRLLCLLLSLDHPPKQPNLLPKHRLLELPVLNPSLWRNPKPQPCNLHGPTLALQGVYHECILFKMPTASTFLQSTPLSLLQSGSSLARAMNFCNVQLNVLRNKQRI